MLQNVASDSFQTGIVILRDSWNSPFKDRKTHVQVSWQPHQDTADTAIAFTEVFHFPSDQLNIY